MITTLPVHELALFKDSSRSVSFAVQELVKNLSWSDENELFMNTCPFCIKTVTTDKGQQTIIDHNSSPCTYTYTDYV